MWDTSGGEVGTWEAVWMVGERLTSTGHRRRTWWQRHRHQVISALLAAPLIIYVLLEGVRG